MFNNNLKSDQDSSAENPISPSRKESPNLFSSSVSLIQRSNESPNEFYKEFLKSFSNPNMKKSEDLSSCNFKEEKMFLLDEIEVFLNSLDYSSESRDQAYSELSSRLSQTDSISSCPTSSKEEVGRALKLQERILKEMINITEEKLSKRCHPDDF